MAFGFNKTTVRVETADGLNVVLLEPITFTTKDGKEIIVPAGATSDGASTPRALWPTLPPFGKYWLAAVLHDYLYRESTLPKFECDVLLRQAMESLGVDEVTRDTIYEGVKVGGWKAFADDRRKYGAT